MADTKVSALSAVAAALAAMEVPVNDSGTSKKMTITQLVTYLQTIGMPIVKYLASNFTNATTTMNKVTNLDYTILAAGTYRFKYMVIHRTDTTTTGVAFAVNFTGTVTDIVMNHYFLQALSTAASAVQDQTVEGATVGLMSAMGSRSVNQKIGPTASGDTVNVDMMWIVEGVLVASGTGNFELYCGAETTTTVTVLAGSSLVLERVN